ncbi:MAG: SDR family oxidoreductase [Betaproteobacteria bacterium]|nr:MAG: SDR family oxidoreductase [Betaproteobacteria bacterium]
MQTRNTALVIGATGVTGTPMAEELLLAGWPVYAISRRAPMLRSGVPLNGLRHIAVDLTDAAAAEAALSRLTDVTHLFYCGNDPRPEVRLELMRHVIGAVETHAAGLRNVHLMQGTKYYGCHLGPFKVPASESDPRVPGADFYYSEEDCVRECQRGRSWTWTAVRPHSVCGFARGNPLNLAVALGIYGSLERELGGEFAFPASQACFDARFNVVDSELLARAAIWCSTTPGCGNEAFNINNGDVFRWREIWPKLASFFDLTPAGPQTQRLPEFLAAHETTWRTLAQTHRLAPFPYERIARWAQGDYQAPNSRFSCEYDVVSDLAKARRSGFAETIDSAEMFLRLFARLREERIIP